MTNTIGYFVTGVNSEGTLHYLRSYDRINHFYWSPRDSSLCCIFPTLAKVNTVLNRQMMEQLGNNSKVNIHSITTDNPLFSHSITIP